MSEKKSEHPEVRIAGIVGGIILAVVFTLAILAKEHLSSAGWIVIPLVVMGVGLAAIASRKKE